MVGADLTIHAAVFSDDGVTILDVSDLQSATLSLKDPSNLDGSPLYQATITSFDNTTTTASWSAGTNQQLLFAISADALSFGGLTNGQRLLHLSISAITTAGKTGVLCVGTLNLIDAGDDSPDSNPVNAITVTQAQAMVAALAWTQAPLSLNSAGTTDIKGNQTWLNARIPLALAGGSGAYVINVTLDPANALAGALVKDPDRFPRKPESDGEYLQHQYRGQPAPNNHTTRCEPTAQFPVYGRIRWDQLAQGTRGVAVRKS